MSNETPVTTSAPTKSVAELEAELAAARERDAKTSRAALEAARQAKWKAETDAKAAKQRVFWEALVAALNATAPTGETVRLEESTDGHAYYRFRVVLGTGDYNVDINLDEVRQRSWSARQTGIGAYAIVVGSYGDRKRYPQKKDGTYSYTTAAKEFWARRKAAADKRDAQNTTEAIRKDNEALREAVKDINYTRGMTFYPSSTTRGKLAVKVDFTTQMTVEEARRFHSLLSDFFAAKDKA